MAIAKYRASLRTLFIAVVHDSLLHSADAMENAASKWHCLVHPVVLLQYLLTMESCHALGIGLREAYEAVSSHRAPSVANVIGMANEQVVLGTAEHLGAAGISLPGGATVKLPVNPMRRVRLGGE